MHVLLKNDRDKKGILVITHKEYPALMEHLPTLAVFFHIILHIGGCVPMPQRHPCIAYTLLPDSRCIDGKCIPYTTRAFTPKVFLQQPGNKRDIDILYISRAMPLKITHQMLDMLNKTNLKCTMVILKQKATDPYYLEFKKKFVAPNVTIVDTHDIDDRDYKGLSHAELSEYYKRSKIYIHSCPAEGESRTIHEAFCSGCVIMSFGHMIGGGNDFQNDDNYVLYDESNIFAKVQEALEKAGKYKELHPGYKRLCETHTIPVFKQFLLDNLPNVADGEWDTDKLSLKLPAHYLKTPWHNPEKMTSDVLTKEQYEIFLANI